MEDHLKVSENRRYDNEDGKKEQKKPNKKKKRNR